jgi:hypothetical protein
MGNVVYLSMETIEQELISISKLAGDFEYSKDVVELKDAIEITKKYANKAYIQGAMDAQNDAAKYIKSHVNGGV